VLLVALSAIFRCFVCGFRYFVDLTLKARCLEWTLVLATLLLDSAVISQVVGCVHEGAGEGDADAVERVLQGLTDMANWAASDCPGYLPFLDSLQAQLEQLLALCPAPTPSGKPATPGTALPLTEDTELPVFGSPEPREKRETVGREGRDSAEGASSCVIS
jgi:hypothetical protein